MNRKKRPWFQLHLSTCIVLMVVAGVLLWANSIPKAHEHVWTTSHSWFQGQSYGWPSDFMWIGDEHFDMAQPSPMSEPVHKVKLDVAFYNATACLGLLIVTAINLELLNRFRTRQPNTPL